MIRIGVIGPIGYEMARRLVQEHAEELHRHFSGVFFRAFDQIADRMLPGPESPEEPGPFAGDAEELLYAAELGEEGLTGALWEACEVCGREGLSGCRVFLEHIPVAQEVIEVAELYDENPYECPSHGAWLLVWDEEIRMARLLKHSPEDSGFQGLNEGCGSASGPLGAAVIGFLTTDHKRLLIGQELTRYLTPPERQLKDTQNRKNNENK